MGRVKSLKLGYYGHVVTRKYESLEKELIQGCTPGNRSRGRQRRRWTDDIIEWTGLTITEAARSTEDREGWRLESNNARDQPYIRRKALNDDDDDHATTVSSGINDIVHSQKLF